MSEATETQMVDETATEADVPLGMERCPYYHQSNEVLYLSKAAYEEIKQALRDSGFTSGPRGFIGGSHARFNGVFIDSGLKSANR